MSLQITRRDLAGICILDLDGPLSMGEADASLAELLRTITFAGTLMVALNLANVSKIDSMGLGTLINADVKLRKAGGQLTLFHLHKSHLDLLLLTKLVTVFKLFNNQEDAIAGCFPGRDTKPYDVLAFVEQHYQPVIAPAK